MVKQKVSIFWFRRDLRLDDNHALSEALKGAYPVLPVFIFDTDIVDELPADDARIQFIYDELRTIYEKLSSVLSGIYCKKGDVFNVFQNLIQRFDIQAVYANEDYEPQAIQRDKKIATLLSETGSELKLYKDQVIFAKNDVLKGDNTPYTVFTPYKNKWLATFKTQNIAIYSMPDSPNYVAFNTPFPTLESLGFQGSSVKVIDYRIGKLENYEDERNFPALDKTSYLSPHLRFGTISIRKLVNQFQFNAVFLSELIWREFFMQILFHFPDSLRHNFKRKYDKVAWRNNTDEFEKWKIGQTGYPMVDAGMRELNATGYMHNRVRMVVAGFLCKHLLIDWRWGEAYFAAKLLDYELSSNVGNWQWAAGTGCDAAPYFRVFNPTEQIRKFDSELLYIKKWVPELESFDYPEPMVEHKFARERAISTYKKGIEEGS